MWRWALKTTIAMKAKFYRSNTIAFGTPTGTVTESTKIKVTGTIGWTKDYSAAGAAYRESGATTWSHKAGSGLNVDVTTPALTAGKTYEVALYLKRGNIYDYSSAVEVVIPVPVLETPTATVTDTDKINVTGNITWSGSYTAAGAAYRESGGEEWSYQPDDDLSVDVTTPSLTTGKTYEVALYLKRGDLYDYSTAVSVEVPTPATPDPDPENNENS